MQYAADIYIFSCFSFSSPLFPVPVSYPVIRAVEKVIVGRPFKVSCEAENGTLPITYTLLKDHVSVDEKRAEAAHKALFSINSISHPEEIYRFTCQAHNQGPSIKKNSQSLRTDVIGKRTTPCHLHAQTIVYLIALLLF